MISDGVTNVGAAAFLCCSNLTSARLPYGITKINDYLFDGCKSLKNIYIPDSVTVIGSGAFRDCSSLVNVTIPSGVTKLEDYSFAKCSSLTSITIPKSITEICNNAFNETDNVKDVYYDGTKSEWEAISIKSEEVEILKSATKHFTGTYYKITIKNADRGFITLSKYSATEGEKIQVYGSPTRDTFMFTALLTARHLEMNSQCPQKTLP